ncbi:MAG: hypothetical protein GY804_10050 [Alphaproteobacteria bacterium]|nr:hypothetical protein [Alphaproteobacteria bacterium]
MREPLKGIYETSTFKEKIFLETDYTELEDENKKLKALLKECCEYLNYPGSIRYIGEGSRLHKEMEEARK